MFGIAAESRPDLATVEGLSVTSRSRQYDVAGLF